MHSWLHILFQPLLTKSLAVERSIKFTKSLNTILEGDLKSDHIIIDPHVSSGGPWPQPSLTWLLAGWPPSDSYDLKSMLVPASSLERTKAPIEYQYHSLFQQSEHCLKFKNTLIKNGNNWFSEDPLPFRDIWCRERFSPVIMHSKFFLDWIYFVNNGSQYWVANCDFWVATDTFV